jgi:Fic family protein
MHNKWEQLTEKKERLDQYRPLAGELVKNLEDWFRIELTYTSNALEGNTLTRRETALVVEKGLTVGGKLLSEHLEATNHAEALDWVTAQVERKPKHLVEKDILHIHSFILKGIDDANAGHYRSVPVRIAGSPVVLPNYHKVPDLMMDFMAWLKSDALLHPVHLAAEAHYRLVTIHPFTDGNGRTARLLMNLLLLMTGYPPAIIRKQERLKYISALEQAQMGGSRENYYKLVHGAVNRSLNIYLQTAQGENWGQEEEQKLLKIGELAKKTGETNSTLRYWTKEGLLEILEITPTGYQIYSMEMVEKVRKIQELKKNRYTLKEIASKFGSGDIQ